MAVAAGVEVMGRVPIGSSVARPLDLGVPVAKSYLPRYEYKRQFEDAERVAAKRGVTRDDTDALGLRSQQLGARAWAEDRFGTQVLPVDAPDLGEDGKPVGTTHHGGDLEKVNPNGGALALGPPLGGTGTILLTKAGHELECGGARAIVTVGCGGGLGSGTLLERI